MDEKQLNRLTALMDLVDTKGTIDEFVGAFSQVVEYLKANQDETAQSVLAIVQRLDEMAVAMQTDNKRDLNQVKGLVADAIASLRVSLDEQVAKSDAKVLARLAQVKDGRDGRDGRDGYGQDGADGKDGSPDTPDQVVEKVNSSNVLIKKERVEGLTEAISRSVANGVPSVGITTTNFFKNGTQVGRAKNINIIEGSNVTATMTQRGDQMDITIAASGGGGSFAVLVPTGTVNGVNTTFVFSSAPSVIVLDNGNVMNKVSSDGTTNWSGTTTVVLTQAPNNNIFGY